MSNINGSAESMRRSYDAAYGAKNYFGYRDWLYRPFIRSLAGLAGIGRGARVLDAGCGQGLFSALFAELGITVVGVDMSVVGLQAAQERCRGLDARFFCADLTNVVSLRPFDCVFVRSCSLYNTPDLRQTTQLTRHLLSMLIPTGVLLLVYNTNLSGKANGWRHHTFGEMKRFLAECFPSSELYFVNRLDTKFLGTVAYNRLLTAANRVAASATGTGGEMVAILRSGKE